MFVRFFQLFSFFEHVRDYFRSGLVSHASNKKTTKNMAAMAAVPELLLETTQGTEGQFANVCCRIHKQCHVLVIFLVFLNGYFLKYVNVSRNVCYFHYFEYFLLVSTFFAIFFIFFQRDLTRLNDTSIIKRHPFCSTCNFPKTNNEL